MPTGRSKGIRGDLRRSHGKDANFGAAWSAKLKIEWRSKNHVKGIVIAMRFHRGVENNGPIMRRDSTG